MLYCMEILLLAYAAYSTRRIFKQGIALNCIDSGIFLASALSAQLVFFLLHWLTGCITGNLTAQALLPLLAAFFGYVLSSYLLAHKYKRKEAPLVQRLQQKLRLPKWASMRRGISQTTGIDAVLEQLEALRVLLNLAPHEQAWLVEKNPSLKSLLHHPALVDIAGNERILTLIEGVGRGSPSALYQLGDEPAIQDISNVFGRQGLLSTAFHCATAYPLQRTTLSSFQGRSRGAHRSEVRARLKSALHGCKKRIDRYCKSFITGE